MRSLLIVSCISVLGAGALNAQEVPRLTFDAGAGFTQPVGNTGRNLDLGWNIQAGGGINFNAWVAAKLQLDYNSMGINSGVLSNLGFPGGGVHVFSATLDPMVHLNPHGHLDVYLIGGGGLYHWNQDFTAPGIATVTGFDPFFGFFPVAVPTQQVLASYTVNKPGVNGGLGVAFGTRNRGKFFAEARYDHIFMGGGRHSDYVPVSFGFRW